MDFSLHALLIVCPLVFLSGFVDSVAGGGGLISIPAYVFAGLPMINAYGCNKFSAAWAPASPLSNISKAAMCI